MVKIIFSCALLLVVAVLVGAWLSQRRFSRTGFRVRRLNAETIVYEERHDPEIREIVFEAVHDRALGKRTLLLPSANRWDQTMPEWVHGRRDQIMQRIKTGFPSLEIRTSDET